MQPSATPAPPTATQGRAGWGEGRWQRRGGRRDGGGREGGRTLILIRHLPPQCGFGKTEQAALAPAPRRLLTQSPRSPGREDAGSRGSGPRLNAALPRQQRHPPAGGSPGGRSGRDGPGGAAGRSGSAHTGAGEPRRPHSSASRPPAGPGAAEEPGAASPRPAHAAHTGTGTSQMGRSSCLHASDGCRGGARADAPWAGVQEPVQPQPAGNGTGVPAPELRSRASTRRFAVLHTRGGRQGRCRNSFRCRCNYSPTVRQN